jgi:gliding motility-associated-like protein
LKKLAALIFFLSFNFLSAQFPEGFEGSFPPPGWVIFNGLNGDDSVEWETSVTSNTGSTAAYSDYSTIWGPAESWLVTPQFTPTASSDLLTFYERDNWGSAYSSAYKVLISTGSQNNPADFILLSEEVNLSDQYTQRQVDLSAYIDTPIYIAFLHEDNYSDEWFIDDIYLVDSNLSPPADETYTCGSIIDDSGAGINGNYENNENITSIVYPNNPGEYVTFVFNFFNTEEFFDTLTIYNGETVSPENEIIELSGNLNGNLPSPVTSTDLTGALTFVFESDLSTTAPGYEIFVSCQNDSPYLTVDQSTYTVDQLVEDVLINSSCAEISNIVSSTGSDFGSVNGIGYFSGNDSSFPFSEGMILSTGNAALAAGPETSIQGNYDTLEWGGDSDLTNEIPDHNNSNDATFIQFDFIPQASSISFNFIFASEEYGTFQCGYTDAFAFLLTNNQTGQTTNLALVPGTADPISVTSVRDGQYNFSCGSVNEQYFASYYGNGGDIPLNSPTNFIGYTVSMEAQSQVIPNSSYTIKLVIADYLDNNYDSAVFLEAGSFDLGGTLGEDVTIQSGNALCYGEVITLDSQSPQANHIWYFNGEEIAGESSSTIDVTQEGTYSVDIIYGADCSASDSILIEYKPLPQIYNSIDLVNCDSAASGFDLTENDTLILGSQNPNEFNISYHLSIEHAENDLNPIINNLTNFPTSDPNTTIYIRVEDAITETCFVIESFNLIKSGPDEPTGETVQIFCSTATVADLIVTGDNIQWYDAASSGNLLALTAALNNGQVVYASQSVAGCESLERLAVTISFQDTDPPLADLALLPQLTAQCELTALTPPTATDNCDGAITGVTTTTLPITASTTITWTYTDSTGNSSTQTQDVVTQDTEAPVADLDPLPQLTAQCELTALTAPTATDSCDGAITGVTTTTLPITASTTITWTYTDSAGNSSTQTQEVIIQDTTPPVPDSASLTPLTAQCELTALTPPTAIDNCDGPITGVTTTTLPITASTTITWTFTDSAGFSSTQTQEVIIQDTQALILIAEVSSAIFADTHVIDATVTGTGIYEFSLDNGPWQTDGNFTGVSPGEHIVRVRDVNGCGEDFIDLIVLDFPRFFTPNGDGYNDIWNINTLSGQPASKIYIFDRYGKLLKMIKPSGFGWDGTYNGNRMPTADYWFLLEYYDLTSGAPKQFRGHFTLKR